MFLYFSKAIYFKLPLAWLVGNSSLVVFEVPALFLGLCKKHGFLHNPEDLEQGPWVLIQCSSP